MSDSLQNKGQPPDFTALAKVLQEASNALLALREQPQERPAKPANWADEGETRSFYFPPAAIHMEKDLLRKYRVNDFRGLLEKAHSLLAGLVRLMQSTHKEARLKGQAIVSLGDQLDRSAALLLRMSHTYDKVLPLREPAE